MQQRAKFGVGIGVIVFALSFLAWLGYGESKTYYHTIAEYQTCTDRRARIACVWLAPWRREAFATPVAGWNLSWKSREKRCQSATSARIRCPIHSWTSRKLWWKAVQATTADSLPSTYRRNAHRNMKQLQVGTSPFQLLIHKKAACSVASAKS